MTTIPAPASFLLVEAGPSLGLLVASVWILTVGEKVRQGQAHPFLRFGSGFVMAGISLLTPLTTLMMPLFLGLVLWPGGRAETRPDRRGNWILLLTGGWLMAQALRYLLSPDGAMSLWALWLRPWFGARWLYSTLWLLAMLPLAVLALRWFHGPHGGTRPRGTRLSLTGVLMPVAALWLLLLAAVYRWGLTGQEFLGQYVLFEASIVAVLAALMRAYALWRFHTRRGLSLAWLILACFLGWKSSGMIGRDHLPAPVLETAWAQVGPRDLLFLPVVQDAPSWPVPLTMARTGRVQTYDELWTLGKHLTRGHQELPHHHEQLWVLARQTSFPSWLVPVPGFQVDRPWTLCRVEMSRDPGPLTLFNKGKSPQSGSHVTGLHDDSVWTHQTFSLTFASPLIQARFLDLVLRGWRPEQAGPLEGQIQVALNDHVLELQEQQLTFFRWQVPADVLRPEGNRLVIQAPTFVPSTVDVKSADGRELGIDLESIVLR